MKRFIKIFKPPEILKSSTPGSKGNLIYLEELIIHEDNHLLVLYKPPTVLSQGDKTNDDSLLVRTFHILYF